MLVPVVTGHLPRVTHITSTQHIAPQETIVTFSPAHSIAIRLVKPTHLHKISIVQPLANLSRCSPHKSLHCVPTVYTPPYFSFFFLMSVFSVFDPFAVMISFAGASTLMWLGSSFISAACRG